MPNSRRAGTGSLGTLDLHQLRLAESRRALNQSRGGRAEHHPTRRCHRFHPLRHPDLLTDGGVTQSARTDLTGDHLTGVKSHPQPQIHTVALLDVDGKPLRSPPERPSAARQARTAWSSNATGAPNTAMIPSPVNLSTVPPYRCTTAAQRSTSSAMISRSRSAPTAAAMSIECTTSANNTVTCLYSAALAAAETAVPHSLQNFEFSGSPTPQAEQANPVERHGIASAHAICPSKPSVFAMSR